MNRKAAKELLHIQGWLERVDEIIRRGERAYLADDLLQEAGDSLMMKLGEAANRLSRLGVLAPEGVEWALAVANRNFIIHQYDEIDRELTWLTLSRDLPAWNVLSDAALRGSLNDYPQRVRLTTLPRPGRRADTRRNDAGRQSRRQRAVGGMRVKLGAVGI